MANGNAVNGSFWKVLAVVVALLIQTTAVGIWKGKVDERYKTMSADISEMKADLREIRRAGMDDRWRASDDLEEMSEHLKFYHGQSTP